MSDSFFNIPVPDYLSVLMDRESEEIETLLDQLPADQKNSVTRRLIDLVAHKQKQIDGMMAIGSAFSNSLRTEELLQVIMEKITTLMDAERSTLFVLEPGTNQLWSVISQGMDNVEIRLNVGEGIAGWVAEAGKSLNICDVYKHEKFQKAFDHRSGFETKTMLCQPVENGNKDVIGVVQVLNRKTGEFTEEDEYLLAAICGQVSIALENSKLYTDILKKNESLTVMAEQLEGRVEELDLLVEVEQIANQSTSMDDMIGALIKTTCDVFKASGVFLTLNQNTSFASLHQYVPTLNPKPTTIRIESQKGIGRALILSQRPTVCQSDSISPELVSQMPFTISSVVGVPLFDELENQCIGALQAVHSANETPTHFGDDELKVLGIIGSRLLAIIRAQAQREEMEKNNRMASMGQMLSGIIHDIKNPIAIISGYVQLMARNEDAEKRNAFAKTIKSQFGLLDKMTRELLDYAKGQSSLLRRKLFVGDFFDSFEELLSVELSSRGIDLQLQIDYRGVIIADESKLQRAILNLARNAADSMPNGGPFIISIKEKGDFIEMRFIDSGEVIPEDIRGNLFDDFVTSGKENGTGLGLSIVKKIVEEHQGTISFESLRSINGENTTSTGTTFTINLPKGLP